MKNRYAFFKKTIVALCTILIFFSGIVQNGFAKEPDRNRFQKIEELIKLIERFREAGFTDEQIKKLEIVNGDEKINVLKHKADLERARRLKKQKLQEFLNKDFLTVNDIFKELIVSEPGVIKKIREELVSER